MRNVKAQILIATLALFLIANAPILAMAHAAQPAQGENTVVSYNILMESIDILYGENGAVAAVVNVVGGNVTVGFDIGDSAFQHLEFLWISFGKGLDWSRYIHKPLWRFPAGVQLVIAYRLTFGFTEDDAIQNAFRAAKIIGAAYGIDLRVMWEEGPVNNLVILIFYGLMSEEEFDIFFENHFSTILGNEGFGSYVTVQAIRDSPYARLLLAIFRDNEDINQNGDRTEFVPVVSAGFIAENAVIPDEEGFYRISLNNIFKRTGDITWNPASYFSIIKVKIPFPVILDKIESTPTNSSFPAVTGRYEYYLHLKDPFGEWEYSWPTPLEDIIIRFKPYNYSELATRFPVIAAKFYAEPYPFGGKQTYVSFVLEIQNIGNAIAYHTRAIIPLEKEDYYILRYLEEIGILSLEGWKLRHIRTPEGERFLLVFRIGDLSPEDPPAKAIITLDVSGLGPINNGSLIPFPFGPFVSYRDERGIKYTVAANGMVYPFNDVDNNGTFIIPKLEVITPNNTSYVEVGSTVTIRLNITNYGAMPAESINVTIIRAVIDESGRMIEMEPIDWFHVDRLEGYPEPIENCSALFEAVYNVRVRPGMHLVGALIEYKGGYTKYASSSGNTVEEFQIMITSNLISMFVLPPYIARGNIFRYPLPHAELTVNKTLEVDNETGVITVRLNITNVGDYPTRIIHVVDYWNMSQVAFIEGSVKVNNETFTAVHVHTNEKIDMMYVVIGTERYPIELGINESVIIEYQLNVTLRNTTFELLSNPAVILYDFGPYEMLEEEQPAGGREEREGESEVFIMYSKSIRMLQETAESQPVETFTQAVITVISTILPPSPGPGEEEVTLPSPRRLLFVLLIAILAVIIATIAMVRRK